MIEYEHIPPWIRITNRHLIDPYYKDVFQRNASKYKGTSVSKETEEAVIRARGPWVHIARRFGISAKVVARIKRNAGQQSVIAINKAKKTGGGK